MALRVLAGAVDPQAGKVAADIIKWRLGRMKPKKYGDRQEIDLNTNANIRLSAEECERMAREAKADMERIRAERKKEALGDPQESMYVKPDHANA